MLARCLSLISQVPCRSCFGHISLVWSHLILEFSSLTVDYTLLLYLPHLPALSTCLIYLPLLITVLSKYFMHLPFFFLFFIIYFITPFLLSCIPFFEIFNLISQLLSQVLTHDLIGKSVQNHVLYHPGS